MGTLDESQLNSSKELSPTKKRKISKEEFREEFQKEAGTLKPGENA